MTDADLQRPDLARELIYRAEMAAEHRARVLRNHLDGVRLDRSRHVDVANAKWLRRVLADDTRWPGHHLVGCTGSRAALRIALHGDHDEYLQGAAVALLSAAAAVGEAPTHHWARVYDRVQINRGAEQEFGTQLRLHDGFVELCPLVSPESVDLRRAGVGLPPLAVAFEGVRRRLSPTLFWDFPPAVLPVAA
ncbi:hypothetical protein OG458_41795 (plasmid) [Streptomyces sp. NBC_01281]|uniref:DUF6624 domain-containing protein n=1 Tax=Streptomyces sp. NBC_01281 TaxID=2903811 RepID=UPI002E163DB0|nr:hypothetical protein OG458_41795 [Streptomyces sp. NBC_01281]